MKSVLLGNGINIQFGGQAYSNRFIMSRIIFNIRTGRYSELFENNITDAQLESIFKGFLNIANDILSGKYCDWAGELADTIHDFKMRFSGIESFAKYYEIPLEDWFMLMRIAFEENPDIKDLFQASKQGLERMVLDAIYNDERIQNIYTRMSKEVKRYFGAFDNIFTLNYDNNIERLCKRQVYHLHGDFSVLADSENPQTVQGYFRSKGNAGVVISGFEHCFCNALLDFSGALKYKRAQDNNNYIRAMKLLRKKKLEDPLDFESHISEIAKDRPDEVALINTYIENPDLAIATDYHFSELEKLCGELTIIGLSPNNDSHIFQCIDRSSVDRVIFYYHGTKPSSLPIHKPYEFRDTASLWTSLKACRPRYNCKVDIPDTDKVNDFIKALNALSFDEISRDEMINEMRGIPSFVSDQLCKETVELMLLQKENGPIKDEYEQAQQFMAISQIALREGIFPSALYMMMVNYMNKDKATHK